MKTIISIVIAVLVGLAIGYVLHKPSVYNITTGGAVGDTNSTPRLVQTQVSLSSTTPLSLSNPGNDRFITSIDYYFTGLTTTLSNATGISSLILTAGTSTDAYTVPNVNYALNTSVATSSPGIVYVASSTPGMANGATVTSRVWGAGTNLNFFQNGTSTAAGYIVVRYLQF